MGTASRGIKLRRNGLTLHGRICSIPTGEIRASDDVRDQFVPLPPPPATPRRRRSKEAEHDLKNTPALPN